ncbi:hypothetical protein ACFLT4_05300 [Chloroflexota bacterium]
MSEWLGRTRVTREDIEKVQPSLVEHFPMLTRFYTDDQKMRVNLILDYEKGDKFKEIVSKVYGSFTPTTIRQAATEAIDRWMEAHS